MKRKNIWLKFFVFLIIFVMMFSVIWVVVIYLRGINAQEEASQKAIQQRVLDNASAPIININTETEKELTVVAPTEEKNKEEGEGERMLIEENIVENTDR